MRDFSKSSHQRKKVALNKVKVQRKPLDLGKYLRPLKTAATWFLLSAFAGVILYGSYRAISSVTLFTLKSIEVSSAKHLTRDEIIGLAEIEPGKDTLRLK
ncbi:MAG: cell division protein FtsQ, partial [Desulfuromonadaceae bacterium]|nr:cell division protein FtsQ [Desulfuromonadaceae bacterium]